MTWPTDTASMDSMSAFQAQCAIGSIQTLTDQHAECLLLALVDKREDFGPWLQPLIETLKEIV